MDVALEFSFQLKHQVRSIRIFNEYFAIEFKCELRYTKRFISVMLGGHLNPAVTMALAVAKDFPWKRLPVYWFAQYLGALAASGTVLGVYYGKVALKLECIADFLLYYLFCGFFFVEAIIVRKIDGKFRIHANASEPGSAAIFANYPAPYSSVVTGLVEEVKRYLIFHASHAVSNIESIIHRFYVQRYLCWLYAW